MLTLLFIYQKLIQRFSHMNLQEDHIHTDATICSVWILTKTRGIPEETEAENHVMHLVVVASTQCSSGKGMKRMELTTEQRWSGK